MIEPIERSISRVITTKVVPTASTPMIENCTRTLLMLMKVRKRSEVSAITTHRITSGRRTPPIRSFVRLAILSLP